MRRALLTRKSVTWPCMVLSLGAVAWAIGVPQSPDPIDHDTTSQEVEQQQRSTEQDQAGSTRIARDPIADVPPVTGDIPPTGQGTKSDQGQKNDTENDGDKPSRGDKDLVVDSAGVIEVGSQRKPVKPGSIHDVNAVGNRNIGGRGIGNWYSTEREIKMGKTYASEIEKSTRFITDPVVTEYINRIGQNIAKNSDCKVPFTIKVIDSDEINAMALPGGFFYVNSGLILNVDEEAELGGVMAHEIAHVCASHAARQMTRMNYAQLGSIPLIFIGGWTGYGIYQAASIGVPITFLRFSREFEAEADYLGVQYLYKAGYDPQSFINFFEKLQALQKRKPGAVSKVFADHPQTTDRIKHSQEAIAGILPGRDQYVISTSEFQDVKARLARIENKRRLLDAKEKDRPSLRRADTGNDPNDRPTLRRREDDQN